MKSTLFLLVMSTTLFSLSIAEAKQILKINKNEKFNFEASVVYKKNKNHIEKLNLSFGTYYILPEDNFEFKNIQGAEYIETLPVYVIDTADGRFKEQWSLNNTGKNGGDGPLSKGKPGVDLNAIKAWELTKGIKNIKVAVIDTGIDYQHDDLKQNIWVNEIEANGTAKVDDDGNGYVDDIHGYDFANKDNDPIDDNGHGTHIAGIIGAKHNDIGIAGINDEVSLVSIKAFNASGISVEGAPLLAFDYAMKIGADVINCSWGTEEYSQALFDAIKEARDRGILVITSAGNGGRNNDKFAHYPSNYKLDNIIAVANMNYKEELGKNSNYGPSSVHIAAPGTNILSTYSSMAKKNTYEMHTGTSMATPHVTGAIALYKSIYPGVTYNEIKNQLLSSTVKVESFKNKIISGGRLDLLRFLEKTSNN